MSRGPFLVLAVIASVWGMNEGNLVEITGAVRLDGVDAPEAVVWFVPIVAPTSGPPSDGALILDQRRLRFVPEVLAVQMGQAVSFRNSDPLLHNIFSPDPAEPFDLGTYPEGEARDHRFLTPGPHVILCNIHPEMEAFVVAVPSPWHAVTDSDGRFRLAGLPMGPYLIHAWHRHANAYETEVAVGPGATPIEVRLERRGIGANR